MKLETPYCKNCDYQLKYDFEFCPDCGQKTHEKLTIRVLFYNTISNYFSVDARFFRTFVPLMTKPGFLASQFVVGKRSHFLHPAQLYLFVSLVFFFIFSMATKSHSERLNEELRREKATENALILNDSIRTTQLDSTERAQAKAYLKNNTWIKGLSNEEIDSIIDKPAQKNLIDFNLKKSAIDSLITAGASDKDLFTAMKMDDDAGWLTRKFYAQILKFYKAREGGNILKIIYDTIPIALFFLLPLFALLLQLFYYKPGRYSAHLVFSFYLFSFIFMVLSVVLGLNLIWDISDWIDILVILSTFFYFIIALKRFYQNHWFLSFFKASLITFLFSTFIIPATGMILLGYAFLFY